MKSLFAAMAKAFPEIEGASKDKNNPHFKSKYADLGAVVEAIKPALTKNGLFFVQQTTDQAGGVCVETVVCHESGESIGCGKLFVPAGKQDAQGYGSALTYARRYSLMTAFGVCPEDDDGNAASKAANDVKPVEKQKREPAWEGTYSGKSALHKGLALVDRTIRGCGDSAELDAYLNSAEWQDFQWSAEKYAPHYLHGGHPDQPEEFVPLLELIKQRRNEFEQAEQARDFDVRGAENINAG